MSENIEKIKKLREYLCGLDKKYLKKLEKSDWYSYNKVLEKQCELNIRLVLKKYKNNEELTKKDEEVIGGYIFFSNPAIYNYHISTGEGPDLFTLKLISSLGSGDFSCEEIDLIKQIDKEIRENQAKKL